MTRVLIVHNWHRSDAISGENRTVEGDMTLLRPTSRIKKLLNITKLDTVFESFESENEALRSFTTSSTAP